MNQNPLPRIDEGPRICVLGEIALEGAARPPRRPAGLELLAYLAVHPEGVIQDGWATALWPDRAMAASTLHSTVSDARRALGRSPDGSELLFREGRRLVLSPLVRTDWADLRRLALDDRPAALDGGLSLVRGLPFAGLRTSDWALLEGFVATVTELVVDMAIRLGRHRLATGDLDGTIHAARTALVAAPGDERLYRLLLRAAHAQGNPRGMRSVMSELLLSATGRPDSARFVSPFGVALQACNWVHPRTLALYRSLSGGLMPASGGSFSRL